ncbi:MAG TPA: hypothetical protein VMZ51_02585 [Acidimicrobiales bacterium]|nr:hypothetical protein [Acidimicrobiales bacterium]
MSVKRASQPPNLRALMKRIDNLALDRPAPDRLVRGLSATMTDLSHTTEGADRDRAGLGGARPGIVALCSSFRVTAAAAKRAARYACCMSQVARVAAREKVGELSDADRGWLDERLAEYAELLEYLHDH